MFIYLSAIVKVFFVRSLGEKYRELLTDKQAHEGFTH
jgi:hypothetical protein